MGFLLIYPFEISIVQIISNLNTTPVIEVTKKFQEYSFMEKMLLELNEIISMLEVGVILFQNDKILLENKKYMDILKNINVIPQDTTELEDEMLDLKIFKLY